MAIGKNNKANLDTLNIKDSQTKGVVLNNANVKQAANVAIGKGNTANMGSIQVKDSAWAVP
ncbi:MAG: hypothetical protein V2B20_27125 [Pseudomonadota bacterium]